jgi:hypothetical protein
MKKQILSVLAIAALMGMSACTRIETGEVGLRVNLSKQVEEKEIMEGEWKQTLIGDVLTFPIRNISMQIVDAKPLTRENTRLEDLDLSVIYNISPSAVSEFWGRESRSFHEYDQGRREWVLMHNYMKTIVNNAAQKVIRQYEALKVTDSREKIEAEIRDTILAELKAEGKEGKIVISAVRVQSILPNAVIIASATAIVKAENDLAVANTQVKIAKAEAERMAALASNAGQSIAYMNAQAMGDIAKAVLAGKVNTIIIPADFKGMVNVK